jgi:hypothetical protein
VDDNDAVGVKDFLAVAGDYRLKHGILLEFSRGEQRRELFLTQVVQNNLMSVLAKHVRRGMGDGMVETARMRMGENNRDYHWVLWPAQAQGE